MLCNLHKKEHHKLHKHEEGAHNSAEAKEGKLPANPDAEDNRTDDCAYCQDLDAEENADGSAGMHDCDMCKEYDASKQNTGGIDTDDCPYCEAANALNSSNPDGCEMCAEYDAAQGAKDLENVEGGQDHPADFQGADHICNCPYCEANKKDQTNVAVEDQAAQRPEDCPECQKMYADAVENQPGQDGQEDPNLQGHETAEEVLNLLDQEPGKGDQSPAQEAKKIDNTELPQGDQMKEGTSVKENFGDAQKQDVSDAEKDMAQDPKQDGHDCNCPNCPGSQKDEGQSGPMDADAQPQDVEQDEPDMTEVLQGGLEDHANEQKKQQVLDMVGQTLQGFKANKQALEEAKDQNSGLYQSTIQMLKAMIALCDLLGLKPQAQQQAPQDPASVAEATQGVPPGQDPNSGPSKKAAPSGVAAQDPKDRG